MALLITMHIETLYTLRITEQQDQKTSFKRYRYGCTNESSYNFLHRSYSEKFALATLHLYYRDENND